MPCQHSLVHYKLNIQEFGAPNGLCSSITDSQHIIAVKKPWRCSSHFDALCQMLATNQHLNKLNAMQVDYILHGMLPSEHQTVVVDDEDDDGGPMDERVMADVKLAQKKVCHPFLRLFYTFLTCFQSGHIPQHCPHSPPTLRSLTCLLLSIHSSTSNLTSQMTAAPPLSSTTCQICWR